MITTRTYAVSTLDGNTSTDRVKTLLVKQRARHALHNMTVEPGDRFAEDHVTVTGPATLHSAMLSMFEWTGK